MDMDNCKPTDALDDAKRCEPTAAIESGGISDHVTATKAMPNSSSRPIRAFFNGAISSRIKRMMQRRRGDATRGVSSRIERMMQRRSEYASAVEFEIEASKVHWSQLDNPTSDEEEEKETDAEVFENLKKKYDGFFYDWGDHLQVGEKIAEGGQAEIFNAEWTFAHDYPKRECVLKVFKEGWALRDLQKQWPAGMLRNSGGDGYCTGNSCLIYGGLMFEDSGRFAFWMPKYWGDLRKLIDFRMQHNHNRSPPFKNEEMRLIVLFIVEGLVALHEHNIIHRDLKASNILIWDMNNRTFDPVRDQFVCVVGDYECSVGVVGTGYWRAPEILRAAQIGDIESRLFTEKSDVYSFAMTCYEVLTGRIPFEDLDATCYDAVIEGERPKLPNHVDSLLMSLLNRCWHKNPLERPSFKDILDQLQKL